MCQHDDDYYDNHCKACYYEWKKREAWRYCRKSARKRGIEFSITRDQMPDVPDICPILKIPLDWHPDSDMKFSPSVDRIDNDKGYIPDNLQFVSFRANTLKNNGTLTEFRLLVKHMKKTIGF